ncbi:MAG TPA: histidinol-phosphate transaminase [Spirochaetia bacterium]|nr:histidinol-phosphate transaminase [Spirochaetia bacterium]
MGILDEALELVRGAVRGMKGYVPGLQPSPGQRLVKLNTNENPYPPSPAVLEALRSAIDESLRLYPSPDAAALRSQAAASHGLQPAQVLCGNGSDEILSLIMRAFVDEGDTIAFFQPSYSLYPVMAAMARARILTVPLPRLSRGEEVRDLPVPSVRAKIFFLTTPNSPYGYLFPPDWIASLLSSFRGIVVADEAYVDFAEESSLPLLAGNPRLLIVRSLSKSSSLAGMRVGFAFAHEAMIAEIMKVKDSYNVSRLAQVAGSAALADDRYARAARNRIVATRARLTERLAALGFTVLPSRANFVFAVPPGADNARPLYDGLVRRGFLVRHFASDGLSDGLRISIGTDEEIDSLLASIEGEMHGGQ